MIKELKKIINSEVEKSTKKNLYKKKIGTNTSKIVIVIIGKLSY